ncbi:Cupin-domain-containing oxidoreductase virC [Paramyrothecium foliicola]|nr:Cupin-domain-containing oxidoreductase virC [Paramyrothecium foliicola]
MANQPLPNPVRLVSENVLPIPTGFSEPAIQTTREALEAVVSPDGGIRRTFLATQTFPSTNHGPLPVPTDPNFGISLPGGTSVFFLDLAPGFESPMHRTVSTDFLIVQSGTPTLITPKNPFNVVDGKADYGETVETVLSEGEVLVQRGQMHMWRNTTNKWVRFMAVILDANKVNVGEETQADKVLDECWL